MKKTGLLIIVLLIQVCVTLGFGTVVSYGNTRDRAPSGLMIWGKDFSGLSRAQVSAQLREKLPQDVTYEEQVFPLKWDHTYAKIEKWLDQVFLESSGFWLADAFHSLARPSTVISFKNIELDQAEIIAQLKALTTVINKPPRAATIAFVDGQLKKTEGQSGGELDIKATWLRIAQEHEQQHVEAAVNDVPAKPSTSDVTKIRDNLGDYTTYFDVQNEPRTKNVRLAAMALNNNLISPGEVFSFNDVVGERTKVTGYLPATIFVNQSLINDFGGGICQDSSTLYQAVRQAHLVIEEKHTHSLPVSYVPRGQDATVAYGILDFRFRNTTQGYLLISAQTGANWLRIRLFGLADDEHPNLLKPEGYPIGPDSWDKDPK